MNQRSGKFIYSVVFNLVVAIAVSYGQEEVAPPDFVEFEKAPVIVKKVNPVYPEIARKAGLEGSVWVKLWVDKNGKVKKTVIQKSASEIFDQAALDAAGQMSFQPALGKNGPVDVWVSIPYHFKLKDSSSSADTTQSARRDLSGTSKFSQQEMQQMLAPMMRQMVEVMLDATLTILAQKESAEKLASFKKNLYDALLAQGFTKEQAMQIVIATALPSVPAIK